MKVGIKILAITNVFAFLATLTINALANTLPINGLQTGELSDRYPNLFVPVGLTFAIWGLIYILLALFAVYQLYLVFKKQSEDEVRTVGIFFILSSAANIGWIFAWHHLQVLLSLLLMLVLLGSLIMLYLRLKPLRSSSGRLQLTALHVPFSIYLGWITVATIANITAVLVDTGWNGFGISEQAWTAIVIGAAIIITLIMLLREGDVFYSAVVVWAFIGIIIKRSAAEQSPAVITTAAVGIGLIIIGMLFSLLKRKAVYTGIG